MRKKRLFSVLVGLAMLCCFAITGITMSMAANATVEFSLDGTIASSYDTNTTVTLPNGTFTSGGETFPAETVVYYPNGYGYATNVADLNVHGTYTVHYRANIGGKLEVEEFSFITEKNQYDFNSQESSASYGIDQTPWNVNAKKEGLYVSIAKGDVFTCNEPINVREINNESFIEFTLLPNVPGVSDAGHLYIQLVDSTDETNYIEWYCVLGSGAHGYIVNKARANGQEYVGIEYWKNQTIHIGNNYGNYLTFAPGGDVGTMTTFGLQLYYSLDENSIWNGSPKGHEQCRICDFDANYQGRPWAGFNTDYAYIRIFADGYNADDFNMLITKMGNVDLSKDKFVDDQGPVIELADCGVDYDAMPNAIVGKDYYLPDATATDVYADKTLRVSRRVYYNYARGTGIYNTKSSNYSFEYDTYGGTFTPDNEGKYSIVYGATDYSGNYTEYVLTVNAIGDQASNLAITLDGDYVTSQNVYNKTDIAGIANIEGAIGNVQVIYDVTCGGEKIAISGNEITGYSFVPKTAGEYVVEVTVKDFVGNTAMQSYVVNVSLCDDAAFTSDAQLPLYFIRGHEYEIPVLAARDVNGNEVASTVTIIDGLGSREYNGGRVSFIPNENGNAVIRYTVGANRKDYSVPIVSVTNGTDLDLMKYFIVTEGSVAVKSDYLGVMITSRNTDGAATFINPVLQNKLTVELRTDAENNDFEFLTFTMQDSLDATQRVKVALRKTEEGKNAEIWVNGKNSGSTITNPFYQSVNFNIVYNCETRRVSDGNSAGVVLTKTVLGEAFNGFTSGKVYVTVGLEGVAARSNLYVTNINGQKINGDIISDNVRPEAYLSNAYSNKFVEKGVRVAVYAMEVGDVLSSISYSSVTVTYKDNPVVGVDGRVLSNLPVNEEYAFIASEYGRYTISYQVKDSAGKSYNLSLYIEVMDMEAPVINPVSIAKEGRVGDVFVVPTTTAYDAFDGEVNVTTFVVYPDLTVRAVTDVNYFTFIQAGKYVIRYMAFDATGNKTCLDYEIIARGE